MSSGLHNLIAKAASEDKKDLTEKANENATKAENVRFMQSSVGIYVRLTDSQQKRQVQSVDKSISDMEKQLELLRSKRNRLSEQIASSQSRSKAISSTIIDSMFNEWIR